MDKKTDDKRAKDQTTDIQRDTDESAKTPTDYKEEEQAESTSSTLHRASIGPDNDDDDGRA